MKDERISFRCTKDQLQWLNAQSLARSTPLKLVKPVDVLRELIDQEMRKSQSNKGLAA